MKPWRRILAVIVAATLALAGCSNDRQDRIPSIPAAQLPPAPAGDLYQPPNPLPGGRLGQLVDPGVVHGHTMTGTCHSDTSCGSDPGTWQAQR